MEYSLKNLNNIANLKNLKVPSTATPSSSPLTSKKGEGAA